MYQDLDLLRAQLREMVEVTRERKKRLEDYGNADEAVGAADEILTVTAQTFERFAEYVDNMLEETAEVSLDSTSEPRLIDEIDGGDEIVKMVRENREGLADTVEYWATKGKLEALFLRSWYNAGTWTVGLFDNPGMLMNPREGLNCYEEITVKGD